MKKTGIDSCAASVRLEARLDPADVVRATIFRAVLDEMRRQVKKWGPQDSHTLDRWNAILTEEVGEVSRAINDGNENNLDTELIQVAAVALSFLEKLRTAKIRKP